MVSKSLVTSVVLPLTAFLMSAKFLSVIFTPGDFPAVFVTFLLTSSLEASTSPGFGAVSFFDLEISPLIVSL